MKNWERWVWPLLAVAVLLAVWQIGMQVSASKIFPSPLAVARGLREIMAKGLLWRYTGDSLMRVGVGYGVALLLGIPLGLVLGWYPTSAEVANPIIQMMRPISPLAWIPVAIVLFGVGNTSAIFLIFLASFFPIVVATINGVRNVPSMMRNAGRNFGLSPGMLLLKVVFPASLPQIIIGLRIALGIAWLVVVAAEMIAVDSGLGYLIIDSRNAGKRYDLVIAGMLLIGGIGLLLDLGIRRFELLKSVRWGFANE
jgi:NitT/TauT family transport system permease protein